MEDAEALIDELDNDTRHSHPYLEALEAFKDVVKVQNRLKATQIQMRKELNALHEESEEKESEFTEEESETLYWKFKTERDQLHEVLTKYLCVANLYQNTVIDKQVNEAFWNAKKDESNKEDIASITESSKQQLKYSSELAKEFEETDHLESDIIKARLKYNRLLDTLKEKWTELKHLKGNESEFAYRTENEAVKSLEAKRRSRKMRLEMVAFLLQSLISSGKEEWGREPRLVQIMTVTTRLKKLFNGTMDTREVLEEQPEPVRTPKPKRGMEKFISSTPRGRLD